jgi:hypothetical protein
LNEVEAVVVALIAVSVFPALTLAIISPLSGEWGLWDITGSFIVAYVFSAMFTVVFAAPLFITAVALKLVRWWASIIGGFAIGCAVAVVLRLPNSYPDMIELMRLGTLGAATGLLSWAIWRTHKPTPPLASK